MFILRLFFLSLFCFFFNDTATTEIYTLSLHDALPISLWCSSAFSRPPPRQSSSDRRARSEEHTSELQSHSDLVCRLLLEKKKHHTTRADRPERNRGAGGAEPVRPCI